MLFVPLKFHGSGGPFFSHGFRLAFNALNRVVDALAFLLGGPGSVGLCDLAFFAVFLVGPGLCAGYCWSALLDPWGLGPLRHFC